MWDLPGPGVELCLLSWQVDSSALSHQGSPWWVSFYSKTLHFPHLLFSTFTAQYMNMCRQLGVCNSLQSSIMFYNIYKVIWGFPSTLSMWLFAHQATWVKNPLQCRTCRRCGFNPWVKKIPWRRARQPTPVFLPGEYHGWWKLVDYSPWNHKESDTTEVTGHAHTLKSHNFL